jgi:hypothetical protein
VFELSVSNNAHSLPTLLDIASARSCPNVSEIPCTRYDQDGPDARVSLALGYALGMAVSAEFLDHLVSLHDHKGGLEVCWKSESALETFYGLFNRAWPKVTIEHEVLHFVEGECASQVHNARNKNRVFANLSGS